MRKVLLVLVFCASCAPVQPGPNDYLFGPPPAVKLVDQAAEGGRALIAQDAYDRRLRDLSRHHNVVVIAPPPPCYGCYPGY